MHPGSCCILFSCLVVLCFSKAPATTALNLTLPHQHPNPDEVVLELHRRVNHSVSRRQMLGTSAAVSTSASSSSASSSFSSSCLTGNPIDDCWRCDPKWNTPSGRQRLADCGIGFGSGALGGKGGQIYIVTDSSDSDPVNPKPGTLRYGVLQEEPLWIIFSADMTIKLRYELILMSYKTIDGRGHSVHITGGGCITIQYVSNVIIHNIHVHDCYPSGNAEIRASPTHVGFRRKSDGDGISVSGSSKIWIDHCSLSNCKDGLIDVVFGCTAITISNNYFSHHNEVMLLGNDDGDTLDTGMQVTIAFNHFGQGLVQRMPRCRRGYIHVVNNDITYWEIYAIGGSANPTINSQGNRYIAPSSPAAKEVTKRVDTDENEWNDWNWRTEGDIMENGAFFVPSGEGLSMQYARASSLDPRSSGLIDQLTSNAGVFGDPRDGGNVNYRSGGGSGSGGGESDGSTDFFGMIFGGSGGGVSAAAAPAQRRATLCTTITAILASYLTIIVILSPYPTAINSNRGGCSTVLLLLLSSSLLSLTMLFLL